MSARITQVTVDSCDVGALADFWAAVLGYDIDRGDDGSAKLYPPRSSRPDLVTIWLQADSEKKSGKNRVHLDLNPDHGDVDSEVERLLALGATRVDVGQGGDEPFVVLADPEGNEFCVLRTSPRPDAARSGQP